MELRVHLLQSQDANISWQIGVEGTEKSEW